MMKSYDYAHRKGVRYISWKDFVSLAACLAELLEPFQPGIILGIARAGLFPATAVACSLRRELFPIRLTRRVNDQVIHQQPVWKVPVPSEVKGKKIAVIDEIADTGETLGMASKRAMELGAQMVVTASLISHSWTSPPPQVTALVSDKLVIFPWDQRVLQNGKWVTHPEVSAAIKAQSGG
jgi:hypoxanthine phosphoribosyltransferase